MNNIMKIDVNLGYDALDHYDYISYVRKTWSVPLATQGWEMFQSPFYYMISAVVSSIFSHFYDNATVAFLLRAIPLLCGVLQVELCYRVVKYIFPEKKNYQIIGTIVGGLCPMYLYYSHYVSNEPLAGLLSGAVLVMGVSFLRLKHPPTIGQWLLLGICLGLALLTKLTAVLLILPLALLIYYLRVVRKEPHMNALTGGFVAFSTALITSGWYYLRNWIVLGTPFVGNWKAFPYWQDPGYRTAHDFFLLAYRFQIRYTAESTASGMQYTQLYGLTDILAARSSTRKPYHHGFMLLCFREYYYPSYRVRRFCSV